MTKQISLTSIVKRKEDTLLSSSLGDEMVMMDIETGNYINLNKVSAAIWEATEKFVSVNEICDQLLERFEVDKPTCEMHTLEFLNELQVENFLEIK